MRNFKIVSRTFARRDFIKTVAALSTFQALSTSENPDLLAHDTPPAKKSALITDVFVDLHNIHKWDESNGDTWDPFWADISSWPMP